ncbi:BLUF domain-containing protein [Plantibacter sp. VKM Ac-2880]|uniref:BLUF domain-containing protein n=1 Tax=Plantibacter sp. VKM Ac-2880 TaxID=2783827 RepID=UPI00188FC746|nr:BLUF domain-containing protein [Plantibacter sp. VKM Ac-2880]MBF4567399.1 BLUF domain-containing protein [Plantibacter sp. VKM Ac-2880]
MTQPETALLSVTYVSTSSAPLTRPALDALLRQSRENNERSGLTGMLAVKADDFFQVIEGPRVVVQDVLAKLLRDRRHRDMRILLEEEIPYRRFPDWTMRSERLADYPDGPIPGYDEPGDDREDATAKHHRIRSVVRWFQQRAARAGSDRGPSEASPS